VVALEVLEEIETVVLGTTGPLIVAAALKLGMLLINLNTDKIIMSSKKPDGDRFRRNYLPPNR